MKNLLYILLFLNLVVQAHNTDKNKNVVTKKVDKTQAVKIVCGKLTSANGEELAGAKITISETGETFFTDLNGSFNIALKGDKSYSLLFHNIGYQPLNVSTQQLETFNSISLIEL